METISDILLIAGAFGLAGHCILLSHRLRRLARSDAGLGATIAALSERVDVLSTTAAQATQSAEAAGERLAALLAEAERREADLAFTLAGLGGEMSAEPQPVFARHAGAGR